jgi:hypothetical protein
MLYELAAAFRGRPVPEWTEQTQKLRRVLSDDYYDKGVQAYRTDTASAIKFWEASLRYDPQNRKSAAKLMEARVADDKLKRIRQETKPNLSKKVCANCSPGSETTPWSLCRISRSFSS